MNRNADSSLLLNFQLNGTFPEVLSDSQYINSIDVVKLQYFQPDIPPQSVVRDAIPFNGE